ncbi:MAG TPA: peptide ABC transporter substrate-binding protein [Verrucomicrobiales bacterium]|nr:peptide ABC transporter substrate-binding protein [Verrucomicrobiales bacterium]
MKTFQITRWAAAATLLLAAMLSGCGRQESRVDIGNREQILHLGNKAEPAEIDPHIVEGTGEHNIIMAMLEGLTTEDPKTLEPVPGVAERWEISDDGLRYTFFLRENARWSNGDRVTAQDFANSYRRILTPSLASKYAYMLYPIRNAKPFNDGAISDFAEVGVKAPEPGRLEITLEHPTSYFLNMTANHYTYWPVHLPTIEKHGDPYLRGNNWTRPGNFVGNGPFVLKEWKVNDVLKVVKSDTYWDRDSVRLQEINFYPIESLDTEERAFRSGQLHITYEVPLSKIPEYREKQPELLRIDDYLGTYLYRINTTRPHFKDPRVRNALSLAVDRVAIVERITRGGQKPAYAMTPDNTRGYTSVTRTEHNPEKARRLLADAGFPEGRDFPKIQILFNTSEAHKSIAEAIQQMWKKELGIDAELVNQEWKVYLESEHKLDYETSRGGWIGDYPDPYTFLSTFASWSENNRTGWVNPAFDELLARSEATVDPDQRYQLLQQAEAILIHDAPIIPIYQYTRVFLKHPAVKNWHPTFLDHHPYKYVYLEAETEVAAR